MTTENRPDTYINITENNLAGRIYVVKYLTALERFPAVPRYKVCQCQDGELSWQRHCDTKTQGLSLGT
jgi:hypothetical protein